MIVCVCERLQWRWALSRDDRLYGFEALRGQTGYTVHRDVRVDRLYEFEALRGLIGCTVERRWEG